MSSAGLTKLDSAGALDGTTTNELLAVLCDGMGGHTAGQMASRTAATSFLDSTRQSLLHNDPSDALLKACHEANASLSREIATNSQLDGMGTTLLGIYVRDHSMQWVSVGDSQLLLLRRDKLIKLNADHSMRPVLQQMALNGLIAHDEIDDHPQRNVLRSALNGAQVDLVDTGIRFLSLHEHDILVIASDGIDSLRPRELTRILTFRLVSLRRRAENIVRKAVRRDRQNHDNTTVMLVEAC